MSDIEDGGPAFPRMPYDVRHPGMTLRDWFAGQALDIAAAAEIAAPTHCGNSNSPTYKGIAARAYLLADAMLEARKAGQKK